MTRRPLDVNAERAYPGTMTPNALPLWKLTHDGDPATSWKTRGTLDDARLEAGEVDEDVDDVDETTYRVTTVAEVCPRCHGAGAHTPGCEAPGVPLTVDEVRVRFDPREPPCLSLLRAGDDGDAHVWATPWDVVGGDPERPGRVGEPGRDAQTRVCLACGLAHVIDLYGSDGHGGHALVHRYHRDLEDEVRRRIDAAHEDGEVTGRSEAEDFLARYPDEVVDLLDEDAFVDRIAASVRERDAAEDEGVLPAHAEEFYAAVRDGAEDALRCARAYGREVAS